VRPPSSATVDAARTSCVRRRVEPSVEPEEKSRALSAGDPTCLDMAATVRYALRYI
jgi:hypothetical protein